MVAAIGGDYDVVVGLRLVKVGAVVLLLLISLGFFFFFDVYRCEFVSICVFGVGLV